MFDLQQKAPAELSAPMAIEEDEVKTENYLHQIPPEMYTPIMQLLWFGANNEFDFNNFFKFQQVSKRDQSIINDMLPRMFEYVVTTLLHLEDKSDEEKESILQNSQSGFEKNLKTLLVFIDKNLQQIRAFYRQIDFWFMTQPEIKKKNIIEVSGLNQLTKPQLLNPIVKYMRFLRRYTISFILSEKNNPVSKNMLIELIHLNPINLVKFDNDLSEKYSHEKTLKVTDLMQELEDSTPLNPTLLAKWIELINSQNLPDKAFILEHLIGVFKFLILTYLLYPLTH